LQKLALRFSFSARGSGGLENFPGLFSLLVSGFTIVFLYLNLPARTRHSALLFPFLTNSHRYRFGMEFTLRVRRPLHFFLCVPLFGVESLRDFTRTRAQKSNR